MIGTMKRRPRSLALAGAALLALMILGLPAIAQERPLSSWRLNEGGVWESLPGVNPYATITGLGSGAGWGNSGASIGVTARAVFEPDLSRAEISAEFVPVSRGIIASDPRLFIAPLRQRLEWKVIVIVRNPNDVSMTNVRVHNQFGKAFRAALTGQSVGDAAMADGDVKGLLPSSSGFTWDIGYLGPGAAAKAELMVTTNQSGGRAEFAEEGVYSLDTGFQLTYRLLGKDEVRNTAPCSVIARRNPSALRSDGEPYGVVQKPIERDLVLPERPVPVRPGVGGSVPIGGGQGGIVPSVRAKQVEGSAQITRVHGTGMLKVISTGVSDNVGVKDDKFTVPAGEQAEWKMEIWVENPVTQSSSMVQPQGQPEGWNGWIVTLLFGQHLTAEEIERSVYVPGNPGIHKGVLEIVEDHPEPGITRVKIIWNWHQTAGNRFLPGSHAYLALKVTTSGLPPSDEDLIFCDHINMEYNPVGSGYWHQVPLDPIYIKSVGEPHADVSVTATRLDWRVRKPGMYAALATEITATGYGKLQVQFSDFRDLARTNGVSGTVPAFYAFGQDLPDKASSQWIAASAMNDQSNWPIPMELDSAAGSVLRLWSMIGVGEEASSAEYSSDLGDNKGVITFIVSNN
ncbi:MAG: hypothetical protein KA063_05300 [Firmicutes bacterium]|jgi:hypothetical protein|nr:hypothetical protein [Bacillota bacterium]